MVEVMDEATAEHSLLRLGEGRAESARSREKYREQLCLPDFGAKPNLRPKLIASVAMSGSDPSCARGPRCPCFSRTKQTEAWWPPSPRRLNHPKRTKMPRLPEPSPGPTTSACTLGDFIKSTLQRLAKTLLWSPTHLSNAPIIQVSAGRKPACLSREYHYFRQRFRPSNTNMFRPNIGRHHSTLFGQM